MATAQEVLRSQHIRVLESMKELARENEALKKRLASLERGGGGAAGASSSYEQLEAAHSAELLDQVEKTEELQKELAQLQQQQAGGRELQRVQGQRQMLQKACDDLKAQLRTQGAAAEQRLSDVRAGYETELAERAAETEAVRLRAAEAAETLDAERHRAAALRAEQRGSSEQKLGWAAAAAEGLQAELRAELRTAREALAAAESGAVRQAQVSNPKLSPRPRPHLRLRPGPLLRPPPCLRLPLAFALTPVSFPLGSVSTRRRARWSGNEPTRRGRRQRRRRAHVWRRRRRRQSVRRPSGRPLRSGDTNRRSDRLPSCAGDSSSSWRPQRPRGAGMLLTTSGAGRGAQAGMHGAVHRALRSRAHARCGARAMHDAMHDAMQVG